ncbi:universal stress protein [Streptomyces sp. JJ36]|uniref:universal stress protein n=1 Tax=Streptomyces sp. JJ36 TaxID=2736645 RepID=UPI001F21ADCD|nr:universal stress protein [Streptomyces sp. JJ36]MCF6524867.1 universal stress protein [Streptomyces sp. JJ36]
MTPTVTVGLDGSPESRAAVAWAADEAVLRGADLRIVQVHDTGPYPYPAIYDEQAEREWTERTGREAAAALARRNPSLRVGTEVVTGRPTHVLTELSGETSLLVLGSRGLGTVLGFVVGSVGLPVVAHSRCPVVLVRAPEQEGQEDVLTAKAAGGNGDAAMANDVVLGLQLDRSADDPLLAFAFDAAARRSAVLRVVHTWELPPSFGIRPFAAVPGTAEEMADEKTEALSDALRPWREKYPAVDVEYQVVLGRAPHQLVEAASDASLLVVGRRNRRSPIGTHLGSVTHAVLHHADVPVAVVPHD